MRNAEHAYAKMRVVEYGAGLIVICLYPEFQLLSPKTHHFCTVRTTSI